MFCPTCGSEERQLSQFCRGCGSDLRVVRNSMERPDSITASAVSAREQISLAIAEKIRQLDSAKDLKKVAEEVLPEVEKFLESPSEKRLRRIRAGVTTAAVGFAITIAGVLLSMNKGDFVTLIIPGFITFMIGIGLVINGLAFTLQKNELPGDTYGGSSPRPLDAGARPYEAIPPVLTNELRSAPQQPSVTEHTTHHLSNKR